MQRVLFPLTQAVSAHAEIPLQPADRSPGFRSSYLRAFPKFLSVALRFRHGYSGGAAQGFNLIPVRLLSY